MKTCQCGTLLDTSAQACPKCGKTFTPPYALIFGLGLPLLGLVLIIYSCTRNSGPDTTQQYITDQDRAAGHGEQTLSPEAIAINAYTQRLAEMKSEPGYQEFAPGNIHITSFIVIGSTGDACYRFLMKSMEGDVKPARAVAIHNVGVTTSEDKGFLSLWKQRCAGKSGTEINRSPAQPATVPK